MKSLIKTQHFFFFKVVAEVRSEHFNCKILESGLFQIKVLIFKCQKYENNKILDTSLYLLHGVRKLRIQSSVLIHFLGTFSNLSKPYCFSSIKQK